MSEQDLIEQVTAAWVEVLDTGSVPADVNFFDVGGDSILLIVLLERLNALTDLELEPPDLFQHTTIRAQAALLAGEHASTPETPAPSRAGLLRRAERTQPGR
ncbi:acyl carrier protein [Actinophytocola sp.]|uniref:acyl carrier protein n=1 Tax=Actinophytocola sp. TaxID=1872138 RepID=UPI003D6AB1C9